MALHFKSYSDFDKNCPSALESRHHETDGYVYALQLGDGSVKLGSSFRPLSRIREEWCAAGDTVGKISVSSPNPDFRIIERRVIQALKRFLPNDWNSGPREIWKLDAELLESFWHAFDVGFSEASLRALGCVDPVDPTPDKLPRAIFRPSLRVAEELRQIQNILPAGSRKISAVINLALSQALPDIRSRIAAGAILL